MGSSMSKLTHVAVDRPPMICLQVLSGRQPQGCLIMWKWPKNEWNHTEEGRQSLFITDALKWYPVISAVLYALEASKSIESMGMGAQNYWRTGNTGAISEAACHKTYIPFYKIHSSESGQDSEWQWDSKEWITFSVYSSVKIFCHKGTGLNNIANCHLEIFLS